jgi:Family of unknown function (DUF5677)
LSSRNQSPFRNLQKSADQLEQSLDAAVYESTNKVQTLAVLLAVQALESTYCLLVLSKSKSSAAHLAILRQAFEAVTKLQWLALNPSEHCERSQLSGHSESIEAFEAQLKEMRLPKWAKFLEDHPEEKSRVNAMEFQNERSIALRNALTNREIKARPNFWKLLEDLDKSELYSVYRVCSSAAHASMQGLISQYLRQDDSGFYVKMFEPLSADLQDLLDKALPSMLNSVVPSLSSCGVSFENKMRSA